ncbi:hypothetical protein C0993_001773 [Termitomyces sp. T159_Od127]|nr:hypothetical protein C0993_001773 [Termitomyces sp. T159_Od127]
MVTTDGYIKKEDMEAAISTAVTANPDVDQHIQQQLIHKVLHLDSVSEKEGLLKESHIAALEKELNALKNQPMATVANDTALPASEPSAPPSAAPASNMPTVANNLDSLLPLHPYSEFNDCYQPPAQCNFSAPDKQAEGAYHPTASIYDIEKSNQVFACIMKSAITLSVEVLCSIVPNVRNQMKMAVTSKHQVATEVTEVDELNNVLPGFAVTSDTPPMLSTNTVS